LLTPTNSLSFTNTAALTNGGPGFGVMNFVEKAYGFLGEEILCDILFPYIWWMKSIICYIFEG